MNTPVDIASAYDVLGLPEDASLEEVQAAYRELAQILHPDRYQTSPRLKTRAEEQFKRVNVARDVLVEYLRTGRRPRPAPSPGPSASRPSRPPGQGQQSGSSQSGRRRAGPPPGHGRQESPHGQTGQQSPPPPPPRPPTPQELAAELRIRADALEATNRLFRADVHSCAWDCVRQALVLVGVSVGDVVLIRLLGVIGVWIVGEWGIGATIWAIWAFWQSQFELTSAKADMRKRKAQVKKLRAEAEELERRSAAAGGSGATNVGSSPSAA